MAKWGEGDPRWIVEERPDSVNVNNWHWREMDILPWSKDHLNKSFGEVQYADVEKDLTISVTKITDIDGEVTVANRKGKVIHFFDLSLKVHWEGECEEETLTGTIEITDIGQDDPADEYDYRVKASPSSSEHKKIVEVAKSKLIPAIHSVFENFKKAITEEFAPKVLLPSKGSQTNMKADSEKPETKKPAEAKKETKTSSSSSKKSTTKSTSKSKVDVSEIHLKFELFASAQDVFDALVRPDRVPQWSRSACHINLVEGGHFEYFNKTVEGKIVSLTPGKEIIWTLRMNSWIEGHFSNVKLTLEQTSNSTVVKIDQTNVPEKEKEIMETNWNNMYFNQLKGTYGWGMVF